MLTITMAVLGDKAAVNLAAQLMLNSDKPAVRIVAALELRRLKDKTLLEPFKRAMTDSFKRQRGGCLGPEMMIFPVRTIASDALVDLGMSLEEVRRFGDWRDSSQIPVQQTKG